MRTLIWNTLPTHLTIEALYRVEDTRLEAAFKSLPLPPTRPADTLATEPAWEVGLATLRGRTEWLATDEATWTSWTGLRRRDGEDHHGPVLLAESSAAYAGPRECACSACQATVAAELRYC